jgi:hypothetical protein
MYSIEKKGSERKVELHEAARVKMNKERAWAGEPPIDRV